MLLFAFVPHLLLNLSLLVSTFWTSERYGVVVNVMVSENWLTSISYYTGHLRSDGTSTNPQELADIPGRVPDWFADVAAGTQS